ncbi:hypothetical protein [Escherichia coli]|uniref:hypothetical protein n=1 Tax=Escherichia coli TaxID=562 RepID=UPI003D810AD7
MLKQQDMTETARVVFNELSVTEPATVGEIAQNTYLSRERCQLILTQLVMAGLGDCAEYLPFTRTLPVNTDPAGYGGSGRLSVRLLQTHSVLKAFYLW